MKNKFKFLGILIVFSVIAFSMTACDEPESCCTGGPSTKVTVTGIPADHNGKIGYIMIDKDDVVKAWDYQKISNGSVTLEVMCQICDEPYAITGTYDLFFYIFDNDDKRKSKAYTFGGLAQSEKVTANTTIAFNSFKTE